jgi:hypothetical protein
MSAPRAHRCRRQTLQRLNCADHDFGGSDDAWRHGARVLPGGEDFRIENANLSYTKAETVRRQMAIEGGDGYTLHPR